MKDMNCLRCDRPMRFLMRENIQLGKASPWWGQRSNIIAGALEADIYVCLRCGKMELFRPDGAVPERTEEEPEEEEILSPISAKCPHCDAIVGLYSFQCPKCGGNGPFTPQVQCPVCGSLHDFDDPQCPHCAERGK